MAYEMVMPYHLHMPSYFLETFTEYPGINRSARSMNTLSQPIMRGESVYQSTERHATGGMLMVPEEKNN